MFEIFSITFFFLISIFIFSSIGFYFCKKLKINSNMPLSSAGFAIFIYLNSFFYFVCNLNIKDIRFITILIFFFFLKNVFDKKYQIYFKNFFFSILFFLVIAILISYFYGEQFYIFRGNFYDSLNYTGMSLIANNYSYLEVLNFNTNTRMPFSEFLNNNINLFKTDRPTISAFISLYYLPSFLDIFLANFLCKILFLFFIFESSYYFLKNLLKKCNNKILIFLSIIFVFSSFNMFIFETDSISQLSVHGIVIFIFNYIIFHINYKKLSLINLLPLNIGIISSFIIYPEQTILILILLLFFISYEIIKFSNNIKFNIYIIAKFTFILIISILPFNYIYFFLFQQINLASSFDHTNNWWGYFGAFIIGSKNLTANPDLVLSVKQFLLSDYNIIELIKYFNSIFASQINNFYLLNILPSLSGIYYFDFFKTSLPLANLIFLFGINFIILKIFISNLLSININVTKDIFYRFIKVFLIFLLIFSSILIYRNAFWLLIKLYFYFSFFVYLFLIISFEKKIIDIKKINILMIFLISIFPIYKFSNFNDGIGRLDSFPSIMKLSMKKDYHFNNIMHQVNNCKVFYLNTENKYLKNFGLAKLFYYDKEVELVNKLSKKSILKCKVPNKK